MNVDISHPGPLPDFLGVPWGAHPDEARAVMIAREGVVPVPELGGPQNVGFTGGLFANKQVALWLLQFGPDGMHTAKVNVRPPALILRQQFTELVERLTREYGAPSSRSQMGQTLYTFGEGGELEGSILCQQTPDGQIVVAYQHQALNVAAVSALGGLDAPVHRPTSGGGCFIATAAYGTDLHADVVALRSFRDRRLLPTPLGRAFVAAYYRLSPPVADWIAARPRARSAVRTLLVRPFARMVGTAALAKPDP